MNDGSAASSLQSLREFSSTNSEFELVDVVGSRLSSVPSKQPSSVDVFFSPTSSAPRSPRLIDISDESQEAPIKVLRPKPIRPVPIDKFQIKWEEEDEETEEENGENNDVSWSSFGKLADRRRIEQKTRDSSLDDSILNRLLHIDPPNKKVPPNKADHSFVSGNAIENANEFHGIESDGALGENFKKFDNNIGNVLEKMRNDFHSLHFLHEKNDRQTNCRMNTLENRIAELSVRVQTLAVQTEAIHGEQKIQLTDLVHENRRLGEQFDEQQKELKTVQSRLELLEQCHLREFVARLPPILEDGSLVLSQFEKGIYCAEMKMLFQSGARFCSGLAIKGSAHFRNYPSNLFNQLIEYALTTRHVQKMIRWTVLNFPTDEQCPWPQVLLLGENCAANRPNNTDGSNNNNNNKLYIYRNWIRKRAVFSDRVVYSLLNQHSSHKFVVNIYYYSDVELFKRMHCFTIRRHRPSLGV